MARASHPSLTQPRACDIRLQHLRLVYSRCPHRLMASDRAQFNSRAVGSEGMCPTRQTIFVKRSTPFGSSLAQVPCRECVSFPCTYRHFLQGEFWITRGSRVLPCHVVLMTRSPSAWSGILHERRRRGARSWQRGSWH